MAKSSPKSVEASDLIERLARIMRSGEHDSGLNPAQWEALRYLARCNRFSNSPTALTEYVAATRGTVSQTINALERKGLVRKEPRPDDKRSVVLTLTDLGRKTLSWDPWQRISVHENTLEKDSLDGLVQGLQILLDREFSRNELKSFGNCRSCRYFQENVHEGCQAGRHRCMQHRAAICDDELSLICASHEARRAA